MVEHCGGNVTTQNFLIVFALKQKNITNPSHDEQKDATAEVKEEYEAMAFLCGLARERYQILHDQLEFLSSWSR